MGSGFGGCLLVFCGAVLLALRVWAMVSLPWYRNLCVWHTYLLALSEWFG